MNRLLFVVLLLVTTAITRLHATDFVAKQLKVLPISVGVYQLILVVRNDNVLADAFAVRWEIYLGTNATGPKVFDYTQDEPTLQPYTDRDVTSAENFTATTAGSHYVRGTVVYGSEIDPSDNITSLIFEAIVPGCEAGETWRAGPAMTIVSSFKIWPDTPMVGDKLRPADVIGISALVTDADLLEQSCGCLDEDTSVVRGPYPDEVSYEWTLEGPGTLIQPPSGSKNTVMYQLPVCPPSEFFSATVRLRVTNAGGKARDEEVSGSVSFSVSTARIYSADFTPTWDAYTYDVSPSYNHLVPKSDGVVETASGNACTPLEPIWEKGPAISVNGGIRKSSAPLLCPEYLTLLSVSASDIDKYKLVCGSTPTTCSPSDTLSNTSNDGLTYSWSIIGGAGELPIPSTGSSIVVRRSASKPTIVQCIINDGGLQANDDPVTVIDTLPPVGKPKAFVGLGDDEGTSVSKLAGSVWDTWKEILGGTSSGEELYGGRSGALKSAYESLVSKLTNAGYDVIGDDSLVVTEFQAIVENPCIKTFAFVGHGASGKINMARMFIAGSWNTPQRGGEHVKGISQTAFNCDRHPFWRDLVLLACETMQGSWGSVQVYGRSHGYTTTKSFAKLRWWAYWSYDPLPPIILTVD
ncbi:MAG: hypothetical protein HYX66_05255 [Ignavibacteria bacterium]|nr:hypothetical protein [Ignavibacteria bacterium]